jgi:hypothetical protein
MTTLLEPSTIRAGAKPPINTFEGDAPETEYRESDAESVESEESAEDD